MILQDGWFDWMERRPGPADKINSGTNSGQLYIPHSAVGYYGGWASRLFSQERLPDGRYTPYAAASVHGWIGYDGTVIQHYPVYARCWNAAARFPNDNAIAFENEGGPPENTREPLTEAQVQANLRIIRELAAFRDERIDLWRRPTSDTDLGARLYEHSECTRFGGAPTACPSSRIPWARILIELNFPGVAKEAALRGLIAAAFVLSIDRPLSDLAPEDRIAIKQVAAQI